MVLHKLKGVFMEFSQILEGIMLIVFGASWPAQIIKTIRVKNPAGKSFIFLYLIMFGYCCGIASKFVPGDKISWVLYIYFIDVLMVATDTALSHYYIWKNKKNAEITAG